MKKILSFLFLTGASVTLFAQTQVPNPDFENWTLLKPAYNYYAANDWSDGSACASLNGGTEQCQFVNRRTTDAQSGTYAIQYFDIKAQFGPNINTLPFWNLDGNFNGPPFTGRPTSASFYYKYKTDDNQPMSINFDLYTGDLMGNSNIIGSAKFEFSTVQNTYKKVDVSFTYASSASPTNIYIHCDYSVNPKTALDTLTLDNIILNYSTATDVTDPTSPDYFTVAVSNKIISTSKSINNATIIDLTGRRAAAFSGQENTFNIEQLRSGIYILMGIVNDTPFSRKIIIE